jgi:hypothetical protein
VSDRASARHGTRRGGQREQGDDSHEVADDRIGWVGLGQGADDVMGQDEGKWTSQISLEKFIRRPKQS